MSLIGILTLENPHIKTGYKNVRGDTILKNELCLSKNDINLFIELLNREINLVEDTKEIEGLLLPASSDEYIKRMQKLIAKLETMKAFIK